MMERKILRTAIAVTFTTGVMGFTSGAFAGNCASDAVAAKAEVARIYDEKIAHYHKLKEAGATVVLVDFDGDGQEVPKEFRTDVVIEAYEDAKAGALASVDESVPACEAALNAAKREAEAQSISAVVDPGGAVVSALVDRQLVKMSLSENNDLRGAIETGLNPAAPLMILAKDPEKVVKTVLHKPHRVLTPWKW